MEKLTGHGNGPVVVMDSGLGGLSVLARLAMTAPDLPLVYYADTHYAPYGDKTVEEVRRRVDHVTRHLMKTAPRLLLLACNTATSAAAHHLRQQLSIPVVGMEPALKPAVMETDPMTVMVAATPLTLSEHKFSRLLTRVSAHHRIIPLPCPGLVDRIEKEGPGSPAVYGHVRELLNPYRHERIHRLVLGCTHYVLIRNVFQQVLGEGTLLVDGNEGTVRQTLRLLGERENRQESHRLILRTSSPEKTAREQMHQVLAWVMGELSQDETTWNERIHIEEEEEWR